MQKILCFLAVAALCGCNQTNAPITVAPPPENVLAQVGPEVVTVEDFQQAMARRPTGDDPAARSALLDELIQFRALVQEAKARGYDRDPEVLATVERLLANKVRTEDEQARTAPAEVTDDAIETYYRANEKTFSIPAKIRAAIIFVEAPASFSDEKRAERLATLEAARSKALAQSAGTHFGALAAEYSYDQATKFQGGDLGQLVAGVSDDDSLEAPILAAAFALTNPGQVSEIISTPRGFYLLKLSEKQPASVRPLAAVAGQIRARLQRDHRERSTQDFTAKILATRKIEAHSDRLAAIAAPPGRTGQYEPPALPEP